LNDIELVKRDGKVALQQTGNTTRPVPITTPDGTVYQASIQHNVWLVWADEKDLSFLLSKQVKGCSCNNGAMKPLFIIASPVNVSVHETGDRPV
jgi:hypothetical protein